jgi:hypothetical protein
MEISESRKRIELARSCLAMISRIAVGGACSENPDHIGYALEELSQVLFERTGCEDRAFEPIPADQIDNLGKLLEELDFVHTGLSSMMGVDRMIFEPQ